MVIVIHPIIIIILIRWSTLEFGDVHVQYRESSGTHIGVIITTGGRGYWFFAVVGSTSEYVPYLLPFERLNVARIIKLIIEGKREGGSWKPRGSKCICLVDLPLDGVPNILE